MRRLGLPAFLTGAVLLAAPGGAGAQNSPNIPASPTTFVTDQVGLISGDARQRLEQRLEEHQRQTGQQVILWIGNPQLPGGELQPWAVRAFQAWKVGRQGKDDGVAVFLSPAARKLWIEVGYGLEGYLTDARASRIVAQALPRLGAGDNDGALEGLLTEVLATITPAAEGAPPPVAEPVGEVRPGYRLAELFWLIIPILMLLFARRTHSSVAAGLLYTLASSRGHRHDDDWGGGGGLGGGFGGGGFGGGGGGGFSGGGGRSGGGGAGGSW